MNAENLLISADDALTLTAILGDVPMHQATELLAEAFNGAEVTVPAALPPNVVGIHTTVDYVEIESGLSRSVTLVPPADAQISTGRISLLSPVGRALLGRSVDTITEVLLPDGKTMKVKIKAVNPAEPTAIGKPN